MKLGAVLHDFPFNFTLESTSLIDNGSLLRCTFLQSQGVHAVGVWRAECKCRETAFSMSASGHGVVHNVDGWNLPSKMCPCTGVNNSALRWLESWTDYYMWRRLSLNSPVAILLHWPLTLYHCLSLVAAKSVKNDMLTQKVFRVHYLGPNQELDQLEVFAELSAILPFEHIHIDFVGPDVPSFRSFEETKLLSFLKCSDDECKCKLTSQTTDTKCSVGLKLWKGLYHHVYEQLVEGSLPDLIFAPNAGIAAFPSWLPTLTLIKKLQVPAVFTDFCEEATVLACKCVKHVLACELTIPMQINPFRQPMTPPNKVLELPTYSNCFLFGIN